MPYATRNIVMRDGQIKSDNIITKTKMVSLDNLKVDSKDSNVVLKTSKIAIRNIKSSPKRTIFQSFIFFFFVSLFLFGSTLLLNTVNNWISGDEDFSNIINISKRDNSHFALYDINEIKDIIHTETKLVPNYLEKSKILSIEDPNNSIFYGDSYRINFNNAELLFNNEIKGRMPESNSEIVLRTNSMEPERFKIGETLNIHNQSFEIVGIFRVSNERYYNTAFLHPNFIYNDVYELINLDFFIHSLNGIHKNDDELSTNTSYRNDSVILDEFILRTRTKSQFNNLNDRIINNSSLSNKYRIINTSLQIDEYTFINKVLIYILVFIGIFVIGFIIYLLLYQIQKNIMMNRRVDFAVYRSIGISEKQSSLIIMFEQAILAITTSVIAFILINIIALFSNRVYVFILDLKITQVIIVSGLLALYLGRKYNKNIFSQTVIESLKKESL